MMNYEPSQKAKAAALLELRRRERAQQPADIPPDPVNWIQEYFFIPETNAPIQLVPYQQAMIREALRTENGLFVYSFVLWSDIKKSAKSTIAGAMALYLAWHHAWESVRIVANDLRQANSRTFFYIERAIKLNPYLRERCALKTYHIALPNHTTIEAIPVDPKGEAGGGDLATVFTEMWAMKNKASQALWSETTLSPLKFGKSLRIGESYAGFKGESPILEPLYETGVKQGERLDLSFDEKKPNGNVIHHDLRDLEVYRTGRMLTLWNTIPRCPWQTPDYYAQEAAVLPPSEMNRMHSNQWADASETFVPAEWWLICGKEPYDSVRQGEAVIIGVDAGIVSDCFAVTMVTRRGDTVQVQYARKWQPKNHIELDFAPIETEIRRLIKTYYVLELAYDKTQLHDMMTRIRNEEVVHTRVFEQATPRSIADKRLYDMIRERRIQHRNEADLNEHIMNAHRKPEDENRMRIVKGQDQNKKVDLAVALSMAVDRTYAYAMD